MSSNLIKYYPHLEMMARIQSPKLRQTVLKDMSVNDVYFNVLHEIVMNAIRGNIPLTNSQKATLRRNKAKITKLLCAKKCKSKKTKAKTVVQVGGLLQWLIPAIAAILPMLIKS